MNGTLTGTRRLVYSMDPALDRTDEGKLAEALAHTNETGQRNGLPLKDGRQPVFWEIRSLSERAYRDLTRSSAHELQRAMAADRLRAVIVERATYAECSDAFRRGLVSAEGATDASGRPLQLEFEDGPAGKMLKQETVDAIFARYRAGVINEIGRQVIEACELPPT